MRSNSGSKFDSKLKRRTVYCSQIHLKTDFPPSSVHLVEILRHQARRMMKKYLKRDATTIYYPVFTNP
jgi:hypothetical protein